MPERVGQVTSLLRALTLAALLSLGAFCSGHTTELDPRMKSSNIEDYATYQEYLEPRLYRAISDSPTDDSAVSTYSVGPRTSYTNNVAAKHIREGRHLLCFLPYAAGPDAVYSYKGQLHKIQSPYYKRSELRNDGWSYLDEKTHPSDPEIVRYHGLESYKSMLDALQISTKWESPYTVKWLNDGTEMIGTKGYFINNYNVEAGIIMAMDLRSPSSRRSSSPLATMPKIQKWSDVTYIEYHARVAKTHHTSALPVDIKRLRYLVAHVVLNPESQAAIRAVYGEGNPIPRFTDPDAKDVSTEDDVARRILGTPIGKQMVYFLLQHKQTLGWKTITKVRVFRHDHAAPDTTFGSILFYVEEAENPFTEEQATECLVS